MDGWVGGNRNLKVFGCATIVQAKQIKTKSQGGMYEGV